MCSLRSCLPGAFSPPIRERLGVVGIACAGVFALSPGVAAREPNAGEPKVRKAYGIEERVLWTTSKVVGSPDPLSSYRTEVAFPGLRFAEPLELVSAPGTDRLFVVERFGKIYSFHPDPAASQADLFLDLGKVCYGLAVHPRFQENGFVFVTYVLDHQNSLPRGTRLSRFRADRTEPPHADRSTETILLEWPCGGHNGGCLRFGPDGYLYAVAGDGSGIADEFQTGQDLSDLLASISRIDVDRPSADHPYGIPQDNPFVHLAGARPEIWSYGLRQAWKISFDRATGDLWAGEVGQDLWEMVLRIERGGNYGWSVQEGTHPFRPERKRGPTPILKPIVEHPHSDFRSVTGGYVYHGSRLPELAGAYVYGDYDTGRVWALRYDGKRVTWHQELVDTQLRLVGFAEDNAGELYLLDFVGQIHRLVPAPKTGPTSRFPRQLSETGLFASVKDHVPAPGLIPYSVNSALWSDGALKERFIALPGASQIVFDDITYPQPAPGSSPGWRFPHGTVLVKTFSLEMERGNPASRRRIETRLLHGERLAGTDEFGDQYWLGYSYIWSDDQTDATLVESSGLDRAYTIKVPGAAQGGVVQQTWHFPSRAECTLCHTMAAKFVLGVNTLQMNKDHDYGGVISNQLRTLEHLGVFTAPLPAAPEELPRLRDHEDETAPLEARARAYLHSNCSHCHRKWGGGNAEFQLLFPLTLEETGTVGVPAAHGTFDIVDARLLVPGDPERSLILHRMQRLGLGRMPHVASNVVDENAVSLIRGWIAALPSKGK